MGTVKTYDVLAILDFNSDRKRMSVISKSTAFFPVLEKVNTTYFYLSRKMPQFVCFIKKVIKIDAVLV